MPILERETSCFPEDILTGHAQASPHRRWQLLYTKARQEKAVARDLLAREVPFYLPLVPKESMIRGRRVRSHIPVFGGYVFAFTDEHERIESLKTNRISSILPVEDQARLTDDLYNLSCLIASDAPLTIESRLSAGRRIRIKSGAMAGAEGTIISRRGQTRVLIAVHLLQQGVSVEIDDFYLEPID